MWSRVAGDALGLASARQRHLTTDRGRATFAAVAVLGVAALDVLCAQRVDGRTAERSRILRRISAAPREAAGRAATRVRVHEAVTINPPLELVEETSGIAPEHLPAALRSSAAVTREERSVPSSSSGRRPGTRQRSSRRARVLAARRRHRRRHSPALRRRPDRTNPPRPATLQTTGRNRRSRLSDGPALWRPAQPRGSE